MARLGGEEGYGGGDDADGAGGDEEGGVVALRDVVEDYAGYHYADCLAEGGEWLGYAANGA